MISSLLDDVVARQSAEAEDMTNTQSLATRAATAPDSKQYSLIKILAIWA
jgi:hypothetical protein